MCAPHPCVHLRSATAGALSVARAVQQHDLLPMTTLVVGAQALLHARPEGYRLLEVGAFAWPMPEPRP